MSGTIHDTWTLDFIGWQPWLELATETDLAPDLRARTEEYVVAQRNNPYNNVLANDLDSAVARQVVHHHVYTDNEPGHVANREIAATTTSRINGCVFCAAVHARAFANASGQRNVIQRFLDEGIDADLPPTERAIVDATARLTRDPEALTGADLQPLRDVGLSDIEILDALNYGAFFANANRLMLTLGEPTPPKR